MSSNSCANNSTSSACGNSNGTVLSTGGIIGVAVGGFFFALLITALIVCLCCYCGFKKALARGGQGGIIHPNFSHEDPSVIMMPSQERFKPQYIPPYTYNPKPAAKQQPKIHVIPRKPPQSRPGFVQPDSARLRPSAPPMEDMPQTINPPSYESLSDRQPRPEIPTSTDEYPPPPYSAPQPPPTNVVENVEDFNSDQ